MAKNKKRKPPRNALTVSAISILNDLKGDIHAGRVVGILAIQGKISIEHPFLVQRMGIGWIMIALYKYEDLWDHQLKKLLADRIRPSWVAFRQELKSMKIRQFRNLFVAHYSDKKDSPRPGQSMLEALLKVQGFSNDEKFFCWTKECLVILEEITVELNLSLIQKRRPID